MDAIWQFITDNAAAISATAGVIAVLVAVLALLKRKGKDSLGKTVEVSGDNPGVIAGGDVGGDVVQGDKAEGDIVHGDRIEGGRIAGDKVQGEFFDGSQIDIENASLSPDWVRYSLGGKFQRQDSHYSRATNEGLKATLDELTEGQILFNPPKEMTVGTKEKIEARISKKLVTNISEGLKGRGEPELVSIKVGSFMTTRLRGNNFQIDALSSEGQVVPDEDFAQWEWDVTPLKRGAQTLQLLVIIRIKLAATDEEPLDLPVLEREIKVRVAPWYSTHTFFTKNWRWIIAAILIPVLGILIKFYLGK